MWLEKSETMLKNNPLFPNTVSYSVILFLFVCTGCCGNTYYVCLFQLCMCVCFSHWFSISLAYSTIAFKDPHPLFIQSRCLFLTDFCLPSTRCCSSAPLKTKLLLAKQTPVRLLARSQTAAHVAARLISLPVVHVHCCWAAELQR